MSAATHERGFPPKVLACAPGGHVMRSDRAAAIPSGNPVIKYGECIGEAIQDILPGQLVHTHNVKPLEIPDVLVEIT